MAVAGCACGDANVDDDDDGGGGASVDAMNGDDANRDDGDASDEL